MAEAPQRDTASARGLSGTAAQRSTDDPGEEDVLHEALRRADEAWLAEKQNVIEGRDCQRFYAGDQWDIKAKQNREKKGRPALTINRLPQFVRQMTGDLRKNPPAIKILPAKGQATQDTANAYNGIIRHIEQQSNAKDAYVKATENAAIAGQGFFYITTDYDRSSPFDQAGKLKPGMKGADLFNQEIFIRPILDPFGALIDPFAVLFDKSDMRYGYIFDHLTVEDFQKEFPGKSVISVAEGPQVLTQFPWRTNNIIRIAAYWRKVPTKRTLYLLSDDSVVEDKSKIPKGVTVHAERTVDDTRVEMYRISGKDILSGPHKRAGRYIPICMVVGEEITMDGATSLKGMVEDARDPQRIVNYSRSASVEAVAMQPRAPWVGTVEMFKGRGEWATAGSENHAFLAYTPDPKSPGAKPERAQPAIASTGLDTQAQIAAADMQAVTGIYNDNLGAPSTQHSGVAIARKQQEGDTGTFLYPDNLRRAMGGAGKILLDLIPRIIDTERQVRILKEDGTADMVTVNGMPQTDPKTKKPIHPLYDLSVGDYDCVVSTGPTFANQRAETVENLLQLAQSVPKLGEVASDLIVGSMDFIGSDEIAARLKKTLPPYLTDGNPDEPPPQKGPDPLQASIALKNAAQADLYTAQAQGQKMADVATLAQIQETMAQVLATLQGGMAPGGAPGTPTAPPGTPPPPGMPPGPMPPMPPAAPQGPPMAEIGPLAPPQ